MHQIQSQALAMMEGEFWPQDESFIKKEKAKARELRESQWWKNLRAHGQCHWCKKRFNATELTMDHIIPISRGGRSTKSNIVPACKECNNKKKYLLPVEWEEYLKGQL